jgi:DNA repair photolyase
MMSKTIVTPPKGRGATFRPEGRFDQRARENFDDGWETPPDEEAFRTTVFKENARKILTRNDSPDIPFIQSINPYQGCEHGCIYCYARPSHAYYGLSPGLDFESKLYAKANAAELLRQEFAKPAYRCEVVVLGANTDPYQPIERDWKITREIIQVLHDCDHPMAIVSKSALIERDIDLLAPMAQKNLVQVFISITTLDLDLACHLEPRAASPLRRLKTLKRLSDAGISCGVMVAPVIPFLTDPHTETVLEAAYEVGAQQAGYVLLRLPHEVADLFKAWLEEHYPLKAQHVMSRVMQMRGGRENDPNFGSRMHGQGVFADLLSQRFKIACERLGFNWKKPSLDTTLFRKPALNGQLALFE